ncbi:NUDIX hydrolase [Bengtsoniella intestinalis]|uniref:NUDIX domain-containing protein n=1 Tax=Bengtsoniella intestinalis TaxID=3073143 RepID=UPI00391F8561
MDYLDLTETTLTCEEKFTGTILSVHVDTVSLPNGNTSFREVVEHCPCAAVVALDGDNNLLMVTQYRYVIKQNLVEIPAGKMDEGETPFQAAERELREETGAIAGKWDYLGIYYPAPGCYGELLHLYLAQDLTFTAQDLDDDEFVTVEKVPFDTVVGQIMDGTITDGKTMAAVLKTKVLLGL